MWPFSRKPTLGLPTNFLRAAFQIGTGLYKTDKLSPSYFGAAQIAHHVMSEHHPFLSGGLASATEANSLRAGYFQNAQGGIIIHCHYDDPQFFNLGCKSSFMTMGNMSHESAADCDIYDFRAAFTLVTRHHDGGLLPKTMAMQPLVSGADDEFDLERVNLQSQIDIILGLCFADACFKDIVANKPLDPAANRTLVDRLSLPELTAWFQSLLDRRHIDHTGIQVTDNIPLKTYATGPVI